MGTYRGHSIYSAVPAAGGGVSLVSKLHLLDNTAPFGFYAEDAAALHALIEAWKLTPSTRGRLADPSLWPVDIEPLIDREAATERWQACFDPARATGPEDLETDRDRVPACARVQEEVASLWGEEIFACQDSELGCRNDGTTAFTVADADGNIVAVTQTLGTWGGNFYVTPGLGFLYNDKLRSYGTDPDNYGARLPYARHGTSIAPTLVFKGTGADQVPYLAVGAAGNAWITSAVYEVVTGILDGGLGPQRALEAPRFLVGVRREPGSTGGVDEIIVQAEDAIAPEVLRQLRAMGHDIRPISLRGEMRMGYGAAVLIENGLVRAGADPRRSGGAAAIQ
jgi:gamma-glutamyltranspeptidase